MSHRSLARFGVLLLALLGCGSDETTGVEGKAADVQIDPPTVSIPQRDSIRIVPLVVNSAGTLLSGVAVTFASANPALVTVSQTGMITSVGPAGTTTVAARGGGITKSVAVTIVAVPASIAVSPNPGVVAQKGTLQLDAKVIDLNGTAIPGASITFTSSNVTVATVSNTGLVTSVGPAGTTVITVSSGTLTKTVSVAVTPVPTALKLSPATFTMGRNSTIQLTATVLDAAGVAIPNVAVSFTSSAPEIVTVSATGVLVSTSAIGSATITARLEQLSATTVVTVVAATHPEGTVVATKNTPGFDAAITAGGDFYVTGYYGPVVRGKAPDFTTVTPIAGVPTGFSVVTTSSGGSVYFAGSEGRIVSYDPATDRTRWDQSPVQATVYDMVLSEDEATLYASTSTQKLLAIDAATGNVQFTINLPTIGVHLVRSRALPMIYASGREVGSTIAEIDLRTRSATPIPVGPSPQGVAISPDGKELYIALETGGVQFLNLTDRTSTTMSTPGCPGYGILLTPDTEQLWIACSQAGIITVVNGQLRTIVKTIPAATVRRLSITADGTTLIAASEERYTVIR